MRIVLLGFLAGALSTLIFHQIAVGILNALGIIAVGPFSLRPIPPLGVPAVVNLAFWGGLWGVIWAFFAERKPRDWPIWLTAFIFGAIAPTLVGWFVVAPLKGLPVAQGFNPARMWIGPLLNGVWGLGTAIVLDALRRRR
ncbi:MAG: hypothetical protein K0S06_3357 [Microvirga sp.]|jgi:hypothetical protein|nr:hypothetical protein [Microvirga sp.]